MPQVKLRAKDGLATLVTVRSFAAGVPGKTKHVSVPAPYSALHSAGSLMWRTMVWLVGRLPGHVAVPIVIPVVPSSGTLFELPPPLGRPKEKLSVPVK